MIEISFSLNKGNHLAQDITIGLWYYMLFNMNSILFVQ